MSNNDAESICTEKDKMSIDFMDDEDEEKKNDNLFDLSTENGLMNFITQPYFKSAVEYGNFTVAPILDDGKQECMPFRLSYVLQRQRWTDRAIDAVKDCVIKVLKEELERKLAEHFDSCLLKMNLTQEEILAIKNCETDNQIVDAVVKICVDREILGVGEPSYTPVMCYVKCPEKKFTVLSERKNLYDLMQFKIKCAKEISQIDFVEFSKTYPIDWLAVSVKMLNTHKLFKTEDDCKRIWKWNHSPGICREPFDFEEIVEVMKVLAEMRTNTWHLLPKLLKTSKQRADFDYFQMYNGLPKLEVEYNLYKDMKQDLVASYLSHQDFNILAAKLSDTFLQMNSDIARVLYLRTLNPMLRKAHFTEIEDAILLVAMELNKIEIFEANSNDNLYYAVMECMPWRFTGALRERFESLFQSTIYPFTIEEDKLLLAAAELMGRNWGEISKLFKSNKTRKMCIGRYKLIKDWSAEQLEYNHNIVRPQQALHWSSALMKALYKIFTVLKKWETSDHISGSELSRIQPPTDYELHLYIRSFPRSVVQQAFNRIIDYCHCNLAYKSVESFRFDRRKFDRSNAVSWASAIHIRKIDLRPLNTIENPTDFELAIYAHYSKYGTGKPKAGIYRAKIPSAEQLVKFPEISRIADPSQFNKSQQRMIPPDENVNAERFLKFDSEGAKGITSSINISYNDGGQIDFKDKYLTEKKELNSEQTNFQDIACSVLQPQICSYKESVEPEKKQIKRGPKSSRIKNARKEAAKARWAKRKNVQESEIEEKHVKAETIDKQKCTVKRDLSDFRIHIVPSKPVEKREPAITTHTEYPSSTNVYLYVNKEEHLKLDVTNSQLKPVENVTNICAVSENSSHLNEEREINKRKSCHRNLKSYNITKTKCSVIDIKNIKVETIEESKCTAKNDLSSLKSDMLDMSPKSLDLSESQLNSNKNNHAFLKSKLNSEAVDLKVKSIKQENVSERRFTAKIDDLSSEFNIRSKVDRNGGKRIKSETDFSKRPLVGIKGVKIEIDHDHNYCMNKVIK